MYSNAKDLCSFKFYITLGPVYNEFGYNEHPAITSRFLFIILIHSNVKKFGYKKHSPTMNSFSCSFLADLNGV